MESTKVIKAPDLRKPKDSLWFKIRRDRQLLILIAPGILFYLVFRYGPMFGLVTAFQKFNPFLGVFKSPLVGFNNFEKFFSTGDFRLLFRNTLLLGLYNLLWSFPVTVIFALLLNEVRSSTFKRTVQTVSYLPTFLSVVIIVSITKDFLSTAGTFNQVRGLMGLPVTHPMNSASLFRTIYIASGIWASTGSGAIIYLAALSGVDPGLYEAARIDGCPRVKMIWKITLPSILPTIVTMFILSSSNVMRIGMDKVFLLYSPMTYETADVFSTYVYRRAFSLKDYGFASAVGIFESLISCAVLVSTNFASRKITGESLW